MPMTAFAVQLRRPLASGASFGDVGAYEELKGRLHLSVDPANPANARVTGPPARERLLTLQPLPPGSPDFPRRVSPAHSVAQP
jgi:hypothetical protein